MFVTVSATLAVPGSQKVSLEQAQLVTDDRTYDDWSSTALSADPGFRQEQDLVFEVDPSQIDDLTLEIWHAGVVQGFYQRARIHLGITADNAEQWRQAAGPRAPADLRSHGGPVTAERPTSVAERAPP